MSTGNILGDIYEIPEFFQEIKKDKKLCFALVNAWDSNSFIGNGGSRDNTIDGFTTAGIGPGLKLANNSFLHNPFFHNWFNDTKLWYPSNDFF